MNDLSIYFSGWELSKYAKDPGFSLQYCKLWVPRILFFFLERLLISLLLSKSKTHWLTFNALFSSLKKISIFIYHSNKTKGSQGVRRGLNTQSTDCRQPSLESVRWGHFGRRACSTITFGIGWHKMIAGSWRDPHPVGSVEYIRCSGNW